MLSVCNKGGLQCSSFWLQFGIFISRNSNFFTDSTTLLLTDNNRCKKTMSSQMRVKHHQLDDSCRMEVNKIQIKTLAPLGGRGTVAQDNCALSVLKICFHISRKHVLGVFKTLQLPQY